MSKCPNEKTTGLLVSPVAEVSSDRNRVVELVLERWLGNNRLDAKTVDRLARILSAGDIDFDLVAAPLVGIAKRIDQRLEVGAVQHHRLFAVEVEHRLAFCFRTEANRLHIEVADRCDDRLALDGRGL